MGDNSHIEWTDETWNVVSGCTKVSAGCEHCYIERTPPFRMAGRRFDKPGIGGSIPLVFHRDRLDLPIRQTKPRRIFVNSLSDLFHDGVPDAFIAEVFASMARAPQHIFQLLTKRHGRMRSLLNRPSFRDNLATWGQPWPLRNLHLGVSVEDQAAADLRIPALLATPAAVRWISAEPLLGPVDLHANDDGMHNWLPDFGPGYDTEQPICQAHGIPDCQQGCAFLDWLVIGGESGPGARPMHPDWARGLRDQCERAGVPMLFKQWGEWSPDLSLNWGEGNGRRLHYVRRFVKPDGQPAAPGEAGTAMDRVGKKSAGRELDSRTHDDYPQPVEVPADVR